MRISDWSSDVCSSDLQRERRQPLAVDLVDEGDDRHRTQPAHLKQLERLRLDALRRVDHHHRAVDSGERAIGVLAEILVPRRVEQIEDEPLVLKSEEHTSELQSLMRISSAVFCLKKKKTIDQT